MIDVLKYVMLPKEATAVELRHVRRINRVALGVCIAHIPLFVLVAWANGTSIAQALLFGSLLVLGPTVANVTVDNPRTLSLVYGFTSMALGALLVHLGQGPVQIEMHFHFFAALALLAVWGNPLIIWVAAITVAVHHGLFWLLLPRSVFNYEAPFWVVLVHAIFVIVESIAASFIARNFFDNVIGLDAIVQAKTAELSRRNTHMKGMLDHIGQGYMSVTRAGTLMPEHSTILETWFGSWPGELPFWQYLGRKNPEVSRWLEVLWDNVASGGLPLELALDQLPERCKVGASTFELRFRPVYQGDQVAHIVVVVSDATAQVAQEHAKIDQRELISIFQWMTQDPSGLAEFFDDADAMVRVLVTGKVKSLSAVKADVHTLKGNSAVFGLISLVHLCEALEEYLAENIGDLPQPHRDELMAAWQAVMQKRQQLLGAESDGALHVDKADYQTLVAAIEHGAPHTELAENVRAWVREPIGKRFLRFAEQANELARRLDKGDIAVQIEGNNVRLPAKALRQFWSTFVHVVRNAVDHGLESPAERAQHGKKATGCIRLRAQLRNDQLVLEVEDDGRGVDWQTLRTKANNAGLAAATREDLIEAMFADGISTRDQVTEISGRGIGMGAVRAACQRAGGKVDVSSEPGTGTCLRFAWPAAAVYTDQDRDQ